MSLNARSYLFDTGALFLFHSGDARIKPYFDRVFSNHASGFIAEINLAEFYYKSIAKFGMQTAETWYMQVRQSRMSVVPPDEIITRSAAIWKSKRNDISLADCYAIATTQEKAQMLITTDPILAKVREIRVVHIRLE